jgi:hypothetical protein
VDLPVATHGLPLPYPRPPTVVVTGGTVTLDGKVVADTDSIARAGRPQRVDGLFSALRALTVGDGAAPATKFTRVVLLAFEKNTPLVVVKSTFQTAAFAGFARAMFAVRSKDQRIAQLPVQAIVPLPSSEAQGTGPGPRLLIVVHPSDTLVSWRMTDGDTEAVAAHSQEELAAQVASGWAAHGSHMEPGDMTLDHAIVYASNALDCSALVAAVDAVLGTTHEVSLGGSPERRAALDVHLALSEEVTPGDPLPKPGGRIPPEVVQRVVRERFGAFRSCYEQGLPRNPDLVGVVRVRFVIDRDGTVTSAQDDGSTVPDAAVVNCVVNEYSKLSFPRPEGGIVTVVYPIDFHSE